MFKAELKKVFTNKKTLVILFGILFIPAIYAVIFLNSLWNVYGKTSQLPVAVVNQDVAVNYRGKHLSVGHDLADRLNKNDSLDFKVVDSEQSAQKGLNEGKYYMIVKIPKHFSENATTLLDDKPQQMQLDYQTNSGYNYIANKMVTSGVKEVKTQVAAQVTRTYSQVMFDTIKQLDNGLNTAAKKNQALKSGGSQLVDANAKIASNLNTLAKSSVTLASGSTKLNNGLNEYVKNVAQVNSGIQQENDAISKLNEKTKSMGSGVSQLNEGAQSLNNHLATARDNSAQITSGLQSINQQLQNSQGQSANTQQTLADLKQKVADLGALQNQMPQIQTTMQSLQSNLAKVQSTSASDSDDSAASAAVQKIVGNDNLSSSDKTQQIMALMKQSQSDAQAKATQSMASVKSDLQTLTTQLQTVQSKSGELSSINVDSLSNQLNAASQQQQSLASGIAKLSDGSEQLTNGLGQLQPGSKQLANGTNELNNNVPTLASSMNQLNSASQKLSNGTNKLQGSGSQLVSGSTQLVSGTSQLHSGAGQLFSGSTQVGQGLLKLNDNTGKLATKLGESAAKAKISPTELTYDQVSQPVSLVHSDRDRSSNNGTGMSPYMLSIGLWIGMLVFNLLFDLYTPASKPRGGFRWWASKNLSVASIGIIQAVIMYALMVLVNGLDPINSGATLFVLILEVLCFGSIITLFNVVMGKTGAGLMLIFLVLQLSGSGGTYPIQLSNGFFQAINPWLPMTYGISALRQSISVGGSIATPVIVMFSIFVVCNLLLLAYFIVKSREYNESAEAETN
ncbi:YhgE/Pip family protein [Lactobacillaceae bacterium Scapto_B20]